MESGAAPRFTRILLTGPPGIGKTTVCKKLISILDKSKYSIDGFYTEEVRFSDRRRIGFDVVSLGKNREKAPLARTTDYLDGRQASKARVGNYHVFVNEFEKAALPVFESQSIILVIDEIGKMELFSKKFQDNVEKLFFGETRNKLFVIATIPLRQKVPQRFTDFFERFHNNESFKVIEVDRRNRDSLPEEIVLMTHNI